MNKTIQENTTIVDNSKKSILARGCDPHASAWASKTFPPLIGNPEYVPTTDDVDFIEKLKSRKWSVVYFAPDACRFSAAKQSIPGGTSQTQGWTLEQYRKLVWELQGETIPIVETPEESKSLGLLISALQNARETS